MSTTATRIGLTASATSGSWPTSTRARRRRPSGSSTTPAAPTRWARCTRAPRRWTGWRRSRSAASRSRRRPRPRVARPSDQHHRYARARGLYGRGRAEPARARRRGRRLRRRRGRPAAVRDRLAPGRQVQGAADRVHQQDGPHRRRLLRLRASRWSTRLGANPVPIQLPIGQEEHHRGVVDLVEMKRDHLRGRPRREVHRRRDPGRARRAGARVPPPADRRDRRARRRADRDRTSTDESSVTPEMIKRALRAGTLADALTPVLLGSAFKNKGVQPLLDARRSTTCRARSTCPRSRASTPRRRTRSSRDADPNAPFSALAFKVMSDPFVGKLTYFRVYSGTLKAGDRVLEHDERQDGAHRPHPPDAREPPRGARGDLAPARSPRASGSSRRRRATRSPSRTRRSCSSR